MHISSSLVKTTLEQYTFLVDNNMYFDRYLLTVHQIQSSLSCTINNQKCALLCSLLHNNNYNGTVQSVEQFSVEDNAPHVSYCKWSEAAVDSTSIERELTKHAVCDYYISIVPDTFVQTQSFKRLNTSPFLLLSVNVYQ